ncbi:MAG: TolC family protein [Bacteroidales bacterium]|nr:TolC family protein [Bacteroidales bacterium]
MPQETIDLSLQEAKQYALENNREVQNKELEVLIARKKIWETTATGLPQVNASVSYQNIFKVPEVNFPSNAIVKNPGPDVPVFGQPIETSTGTYALTMVEGQPIKLAAKQNTTLNLTVSQLIFSGSYIVGLQASKVYKQLAAEQLEKSEIDVKAQTTDTYYMILVLEENFSILKNTLENVEKTEYEISEMLKEGFVEDTDLDQMKLNRMTIENGISELKNQIAVSYDLLKLQIGMDRENSIRLTDKIENIKEDIPVEALMKQDFNLENNLNYRMLTTQEDLTELDWKLKKSEFLPTISGFYRHEEITNAADFNTSIPDLIGVNVDIPIFHSAGRFAKVKQAKLKLEQTKNQKEQAIQGLYLEVEQARNNFSTTVESYNNEKKNLEIAEKIYQKTLEKYKEGIAGSMDLTQANNQLLNIQSNYYQSLLNMLQAKVQLNKKLNNL